MKKPFLYLVALSAIVVAAVSLTEAMPKQPNLNASQLPMLNASNTMTSAPRKAHAKVDSNELLYWTTAVSCYNDAGQGDMENGVTHEYGTHITIDGDKATVYGLVHLYYGNITNEYPLVGSYNDVTGTINIPTGTYSPSKSVNDYTRVADVTFSDGRDMTLVLLAGDLDNNFDLDSKDQLVLKVSDDMKTISSRTGFGLLACYDNETGSTDLYDYYHSGVEMHQAEADTPLKVSDDYLDFKGFYICESIPAHQIITISNPSSQEVSYNIASSSDNLVASPSFGYLPACSSKEVEVTLTASRAGTFRGSLTVTSSDSNYRKVIDVNVEVSKKSDYQLIVKPGSEPVSFTTSSNYPFILTEYDGHIAAASTNQDDSESYLTCSVDVPEGKTGIFTWNAAMLTRQPNSLVIIVDGEDIKFNRYHNSAAPVDMSDKIALSSGKHEITFLNSVIMKNGFVTVSYVWDIDFTITDKVANSAILLDTDADFGKTFYDRLSVETEKTVTLLNTGSEPLQVIGINGDAHFSGRIPDICAGYCEKLSVPLVWTATGVGADNGSVTISTTAGDFIVDCFGQAEAIPYDYSVIVSKGEISFNTATDWPFIPSDNGKYFYNSSSKSDISEPCYSWIEASFDVPEGKVATLSWKAFNDSQDLRWMFDIPGIVSGSEIYIDGDQDDKYAIIGGVGSDCSSEALFDATQLTFKPGHHTVMFSYRKASNDPSSVFGEDRLMLSNIELNVSDSGESMSKISTTEIDYPEAITVGCAGHFPIKLYNYTSLEPQLLSYESDGPFAAKAGQVEDGDLNLLIEFMPTAKGTYSNDLTIYTNIGDYTVHCTGKGIDSELGTSIYYESFEYDFQKNWIIHDLNEDGNSWQALSPVLQSFDNLFGTTTGEGTESLVAFGYDPSIFQKYATDEVILSPVILIPDDGVTFLQFKFVGYTYSSKTLEILAGEGDDFSTYLPVGYIDFDMPTLGWEIHEFDLAEFAGKNIRIAFKAKDLDYYVGIDDVLVATTGTVGVSSSSTVDTVKSVEYYSIDGKRLSQPENGVCVVKTTYIDGRISTHKIIGRR